MKIGVLSDIHGNVDALEAAISQLNIVGVQKILCAGDIVGYYPFVNEVIDILRENRIISVMGNHDAMLCGYLSVSEATLSRYMLDKAKTAISKENMSWIGELPLERDLMISNLRIKMYHGSPNNPLGEYVFENSPEIRSFEEDDTQITILGHTHRAFIKHLGKTTILNPGSCGQPRDKIRGASFGVIDTDTNGCFLERIIYNLKPLISELRNQHYPEEYINVFQ